MLLFPTTPNKCFCTTWENAVVQKLHHFTQMLNHCFASFKQSLLDFFKLVDSRLILMLSYDSLNLIISGVHQSHLGSWGHRLEKVKMRGLDNVTCKMCQCAVLLKNKIIIHSVFVSYWHFVKMVEHLHNDIHWHAIHAWWRKTSIPDMVLKRPDTMADTRVWAKQVAECLFPYLDLVWCTYPIVLWMKSSVTVIRR